MRIRLWLVAAALSPGLAACGDDSETTVTVQGTEPTEQTVTEQTDDATTEAATEQKIGPAHFQTPTGNIGCVFGGGQVRCDIAERSWSPPPAPADCELDYGQGISLSARGEPSFVCAGDTALGGPAPLGYGSSAQRGFLRCTSEQDGVTCTDIRDGGGFFISRQSYRFL
jgi:hypothetical protein